MCAHACVVVLVDEVNREWQAFAVGAVLSLGVLMNKWRKVANMRHIFAGQVADADAVHDDDVDAKLAKRGSNDWSAKETNKSSRWELHQTMRSDAIQSESAWQKAVLVDGALDSIWREAERQRVRREGGEQDSLSCPRQALPDSTVRPEWNSQGKIFGGTIHLGNKTLQRKAFLQHEKIAASPRGPDGSLRTKAGIPEDVKPALSLMRGRRQTAMTHFNTMLEQDTQRTMFRIKMFFRDAFGSCCGTERLKVHPTRSIGNVANLAGLARRDGRRKGRTTGPSSEAWQAQGTRPGDAYAVEEFSGSDAEEGRAT